ncbi:hypothetical protein [Streptomyces sp. NPDC088789]|uniref:hypothetical protein n=1 Tax=Streptomyces sp. NPDC088789 TaxID=3365899 RepID=UPI003824607A
MPPRPVLTLSALAAATTVALSFAATKALAPAESGPVPVTTASRDSTSDVSDAAVLSSEQLRNRLLDAGDLGHSYTSKPERTGGQDDVTVIGCPALEQLGDQAGTGAALGFPRRAEAAFTRSGQRGADLTVELYSDVPDRLAQGAGHIFTAMASCPVHQLVLGDTPVKVTVQKLAPPLLGDQQWSHLMTLTTIGLDTVVKQTAVRSGTVLVVVSGTPELVDTHVEKALAKAAPGD